MIKKPLVFYVAFAYLLEWRIYLEGLAKKSISGFMWSFVQVGSSQIISFVVSLFLARLLSPTDYGLIAMIAVFTSLANVFVTSGLSSSIIQKKDLSKIEINTIFYSGVAISLVIYAILYISSKGIASFYHEPYLEVVLKVYGITVVINSFGVVQQALVKRNYYFKNNFRINALSGLIGGITGIIMAYMGFGVWALVSNSLMGSGIYVIMLWYISEWRPTLSFSFKILFRLLPYNLRILLTNLLSVAMNNIRSLVIGRVYTSEDLALYNRGYQFPTLAMNLVDGASAAVMFSTFSNLQSDKEKLSDYLRYELQLIYFAISPLLIGMYASADVFIPLLLSDKWSGSVLYVRLVVILCMNWPLNVINHALNAVGRSDVTLRLSIMGNTLTLLSIIVTYKVSVMCMVVATIVVSYLVIICELIIAKKVINADVGRMLFDIGKSIITSIIMGGMVWLISRIEMNIAVCFAIQVFVGIVCYVGVSYLLNKNCFLWMIELIKKYLLSRYTITKGNTK